ncbi:MAG: hypothetical protein IJO87_07705 [Eggerthellaceae bacterium]|nr:hypothetical protein [Eggerthellaceae bacterium]
MSLLGDVKVAVRVSSAATDPEIQMWIDAALADMKRVGIREELLLEASPDPLVKAAVVCYVKANYGYDVAERPQFEESYRRITVGLMNSGANVASGESDV